MTDLTKASEALLANVIADWDIDQFGLYEDARARLVADLLAIEAAVRSDTLADVAARLPEALHDQGFGCNSYRCSIGLGSSPEKHEQDARFLMAHLTGGCGFVGCGGVRDDVYHEPCLPGGVFHDHKACHPFQPAPTPAPRAAVRAEAAQALAPTTDR